MKRLGLITVLAIAIGVAVYTAGGGGDTITVSAGKARPMGADGRFMATLDIENTGGADRLLSVSSPKAMNVGVMNPSGGDAPLVVPGTDRAQLAMDGAHLMVMTAPDALPTGGFLPVTLVFEKAGEVTARLQNTGPSAMDHSGPGVDASPAPTLALAWTDGPTAQGGTLAITTKNITFVTVEDGTAHVPGEGHAHAYLNGLKLGRVYSDSLTIGALLPGDYVLTVSLNTHDHRPYWSDGAPVLARVSFKIPNTPP